MIKDQAQYKAKMAKNYKCHLCCRILTWIWLCITLCLLVVWIVFAEQASIEVSNTITAVVDASETFEGVAVDVFKFVQDIQDLEYTFNNCTGIIDKRIIQKIPTNEKIENIFASIDDIENYLPNTTNIKQFLVDVNDTINSIPELDLLSQKIDEAEAKVKKIKYEHLTNIYNEVDDIDKSIDSVKIDLNDLEESVTEANTEKTKLSNNINGMKTTRAALESTCQNLDENIEFVTENTTYANIEDPGDLQTKLSNIKANTITLKTQADELTNGITEMENSKEQLNQYSDSIEGKVNSIDTTLDTIQIKKIKDQIDETNTTINELNDITIEVSTHCIPFNNIN